MRNKSWQAKWQGKHVCTMLLTVKVDNGDVCTTDYQCLTHDESESSRATSDKSDTALEGEAGKCALEVKTSTSLDGCRLWKVGFVWVLHLDCVVCSGVGTGVLAVLAFERTMLVVRLLQAR